MSSGRGAAAGIALAAMCVSGTGSTEPSAAPMSIGVSAVGCGAGLREVQELADRLSVELAPVRIERRTTPPLLEVVTSCTAVESVTWRSHEVALTRPVSLADVAPDLHAVALAVVSAEFLRSIWATPVARTASAEAASSEPASTEASAAELATAPIASAAALEIAAPTASAVPPARAPIPAVADQPVSRRRRAPSTGPHLGASGLVLLFASPASLLGGGDLSFDASHLFASAKMLFGREHDGLGDVTLGIAALSLGDRFTIVDSVHTVWSVVGAVDLGYTWGDARGAGADIHARSTRTFFASLAVGPQLEYSLGRDLSLVVGVRGGFARGLSITADRREITGTQGLLLESGAGFRYAL